MRHQAASVSIDLDNQWSYLRTQGLENWEESASYLDLVTPRILASLQKCHVSATFFVVGRDAAAPQNGPALRSIADAGHEVGNHSFEHDVAMAGYSRHELHRDFVQSERAIQAATGQMPFGFRGPGFCSSPLLHEVLYHRGYRYDASLLPTHLGPAARLYFNLLSSMPSAEKQKRSGLYGGFLNGFKPLKPYALERDFVEMPVTTMPFTRLPVHLSYLMFLARHSEALARLYWRTAVALCRLAGVGPSLLLHPTDFLDAAEVPAMAFFPAMSVSSSRKTALVDFTLETLNRHWSPGTLAIHAAASLPESIAAPACTSLSTAPTA